MEEIPYSAQLLLRQGLEADNAKLRAEERDTRNQYTALKHSAGDRIAFLELQNDEMKKWIREDGHNHTEEKPEEWFWCDCSMCKLQKSEGKVWKNASDMGYAQKPKQEAQIGDRPQDICALCYHPNDDVAHQRCLAERATLKRVEASPIVAGACHLCGHTNWAGNMRTLYAVGTIVTCGFCFPKTQ